MVGRASLIVILGFSILFGVASQYWNRSSNRAIQNFVSYYDTTMAHNIAVSAANIACDSVYFGGWKDTLSTTHMPSGNFSGGASSASAGSYTITAARQTWHGYNYLFVIAASQYQSSHGVINDTVKILLQPKTFSQYAFYSVNENSINWVSGDTVWGPFHTEGEMYVGSGGQPVFWGRATAVGGTNGQGTPHFYGGYQAGNAVSVPMPTDISQTANAAPTSSTFTNPSTGNSYDLYMTFNADGTVTYSDSVGPPSNGKRTNKISGSNISSSSLFGASGNAVVLVKDGDAHIQGTLSGQVTIVAQQGSSPSWTGSTYKNGSYQTPSNSDPGNNLYAVNSNSTHDGNVIIESSITYKNDPQSNSSSTDMLGIVADNSVALNNQKNTGNITIDAAIFARQGSFVYLDYDKSVSGYPTGIMGTINMLGSITNKTRGGVGQGSPLSNGYHKNYRFDNRFKDAYPPFFPFTNTFEMISWRE